MLLGMPKKRNYRKKNQKLLDVLIKTGEDDAKNKRRLIERDMSAGALSLVDSLDEKIFATPEIFFVTVLDLWKNLKLI
jgi:hypothetical protein